MSWERDPMSWERDKYFFTCPLRAAVENKLAKENKNENKRDNKYIKYSLLGLVCMYKCK